MDSGSARHVVHGLREGTRSPNPAQFEPGRYLEARTTDGRLGRAIEQCPSVWAYGDRVEAICSREAGCAGVG